VVVLVPEIFVTVPSVEFPPTTPFTSHLTFAFPLPLTCAVKSCVDERGTLAEPGVTTTVNGGVIVTFIVAGRDGSAVGVAVSVTTLGTGADAGA
jgi:hypothetical protein